MTPNYRQLKTLITVFELKSITKASKKLHLTQPAITAQIKNLERIVGHVLIEKSGRGIKFTDKAMAIIQQAYVVDESMLKLSEIISKNAFAESENLRIMLKISSMPMFFYLLQQFSHNKKNISLTVDVGSSFTQLISSIINRQFDLVTIAIPSADPNINFIPVYSYKIFAVASKNHPLTKQESVEISDLKKETFVVGQVDTIEYHVFNQHLEKYNLNKIHMNNNFAVRYALRFGFGVGLIPTFNYDLDLSMHGLAKINIEPFPVEETLYIAHLKDTPLPDVALDFIQYVKEVGAKRDLFNLKNL